VKRRSGVKIIGSWGEISMCNVRSAVVGVGVWCVVCACGGVFSEVGGAS